MPAGYNVKAAFVREADLFERTWPSAEPAVATEILPLLAENVSPQVGQVSIATVDNDGQASLPLKLSDSAGGEVMVEARYSGLEFFLAACLGFQAKRIEGTLQPEALGGGAFRHLYEIDPHLEGEGWFAGDGWVADDAGFVAGLQKLRRGTYVIDKGVLLWESLSCMALGLVINGNGNSGVTMQTTLAGHTTILGTFVSNDLSALVCTGERVAFTDMVFKVGPTTSLPLTILDVVPEVVGFNISLINNLSAPMTQDSVITIDEPARTGPIEIRGGFAVPSYKPENDDLSFDFQAGTELTALIEFVGPEIAASGEDFTLRIYMPSLRITGVNIEVAGPEQIIQNYEFTLARPTANPDGFPANIKNGTMMVELINDVSTHALIT